jgi:hypothetical protein
MGEPLNFFFQVHSHSIVDSVAIAPLNIMNGLPALLCPLPLTLLASLAISPLLHSLGHGAKLVILSPVPTLAPPI